MVPNNTILHPIAFAIITGWLSTRDQLHIDLRPYCSYRDALAVIDSVVMKGRCIIVPQDLQQQVLDHLHLNHMGFKKHYSHANWFTGPTLILTQKITSKVVSHVLSFSRCSPSRR